MKWPSTRTIVTGLLVIVIPLGVLLASQIGSDRGAGELVGNPVPSFDLPILDGGGATLSNADLEGTTYLLNFWNDWCVPCRQEHPSLVEFHEAHADDPNVRLIGIVRDENSLDDIREYVQREGVAWTVLLDPNGSAKVGFRTTGQPETFAVGPDGVVRDVHLGPATFVLLESMVATAAVGES